MFLRASGAEVDFDVAGLSSSSKLRDTYTSLENKISNIPVEAAARARRRRIVMHTRCLTTSPAGRPNRVRVAARQWDWQTRFGPLVARTITTAATCRARLDATKAGRAWEGRQGAAGRREVAPKAVAKTR